mgnify:FL=1
MHWCVSEWLDWHISAKCRTPTRVHWLCHWPVVITVKKDLYIQYEAPVMLLRYVQRLYHQLTAFDRGRMKMVGRIVQIPGIGPFRCHSGPILETWGHPCTSCRHEETKNNHPEGRLSYGVPSRVESHDVVTYCLGTCTDNSTTSCEFPNGSTTRIRRIRVLLPLASVVIDIRT